MKVYLRFSILSLMLALLPVAVIAQFELSGIVKDASSNEVLPFANVFIANTQIGTTVQEDGRFFLKRVASGNQEIVVSFVGYETLVYRLNVNEYSAKKEIELSLKRMSIELAGVDVKALSKKKRKRYLKKFTSAFLGETENAAHCKILNPEVLDFKKEGKKIPVKRIYNRVILDELEQHQQLETSFKMTDEVDVTWVTHPDWFFKTSKVVLPWLNHSNVPKSYYADEMPEGADLKNYVLKPLYSFAGQGVKLAPTASDIASLKNSHNYILQKKVSYAPAFLDFNNDLARAEIRMMYIWPDESPKPIPAINLVRMTKSEMINVDHNKSHNIFTGSSIALFSK